MYGMKKISEVTVALTLLVSPAFAQNATVPSELFGEAKFDAAIGNERRVLIEPGDNPVVTVHILNIGQNEIFATWDKGTPFDNWHHHQAIPPGGSISIATDELAVQNSASGSPSANYLGWFVYKTE